MNVLSFDKQVAVIAALTEGMSIRSIERTTGIHRDTIMRLGVRVGAACARLCRVHETHRMTPAMALGIADRPWSIGELVAAVLADEDRPELGARYGRFTVIDGGLS